MYQTLTKQTLNKLDSYSSDFSTESYQQFNSRNSYTSRISESSMFSSFSTESSVSDFEDECVWFEASKQTQKVSLTENTKTSKFNNKGGKQTHQKKFNNLVFNLNKLNIIEKMKLKNII